ncbi:hypothetical protein KFZ76_02200 [Methylovulum psychrotolerans]|uniref:hypothetical protein n=1 Tax=Methylovulum psychrotolerans TaxID=1704499 RepID=UPI001BFF16CD|nr:hypothetical protein [Methylovulum psychrotolerans]MBT9096521.1 hypothetical protein [Methylovulum psychrotolerans]
MYAVEFTATVENGLIVIPEEYRAICHSRVRVLVWVDDVAEAAEPAQSHADFFTDLRNRSVKVPPGLDIDRLMAEMNDGLVSTR